MHTKRMKTHKELIHNFHNIKEIPSLDQIKMEIIIEKLRAFVGKNTFRKISCYFICFLDQKRRKTFFLVKEFLNIFLKNNLYFLSTNYNL